MDYVYLYGSSVRMGHKVYIIPILLGVGTRQGAGPNYVVHVTPSLGPIYTTAHTEPERNNGSL